MRDRQHKEDKSTEAADQLASKRKLEDKQRAGLDTVADEDPHICRGTD
jgi:hypothetical protein